MNFVDPLALMGWNFRAKFWQLKNFQMWSPIVEHYRQSIHRWSFSCHYQIKGLSTEKILTAPKISSTYMPDGARKTLSEISNFQGGNAIFTFPNTPIKCAGAPQKICYLFESSLKKVFTFVLLCFLKKRTWVIWSLQLEF